MSDNSIRVYSQYAWKPEYEGLPITYGGFAIIQGMVEGCPAVCIKQRNGKGSSPYLFDLPGGGKEDNTGVDPDLRATAVREAKEEVNLECLVEAAIGEPLYLLIKDKQDRPVRVDCAQAFLMRTWEMSMSTPPAPTEEALVVAFVHEKSFAGFNVVSRKADPTSPVFGRTPVMIFDGLSILQEPFWRGALTDNLKAAIIGDPKNTEDFLLVDGGAYLGEICWSSDESPDNPSHIALYRRLNPDQPDGYFRGNLEYLVSG